MKINNIQEQYTKDKEFYLGETPMGKIPASKWRTVLLNLILHYV